MSGSRWMRGMVTCALLAFAITACSSSGSKHDDDSSSASISAESASTSASAGLALAWERSNFSGSDIIGLHADGDLVYVQTRDNAIHALGADGVHRWVSRELNGKVTWAPASNGWGVAFLAGSDLYVIDRAYGNLTLKKRLPFPPSTDPVMSDSTLYISSFVENRIHTVDLDTGLAGWSYRTAEGCTAAPVIVGKAPKQTVYFAGLDGEVMALPAIAASGYAPDGAAWRSRAYDSNTADLVTDGSSHVLCASEDSKLYAFDRITGDTRWTFPSGTSLESSPVVGGGAVYQRVGDHLHAIDLGTGAVKWQFEHELDDDSWVAAGDDYLYISCHDGLHSVDAATGKINRSYDVDMGDHAAAFAGLLVVGEDSHLKALRF